MFDSPILEAAIGMTLIFLLFSLVVSGINELVLGHLARWRSHVLEEGIRSMLTGLHVQGSTTKRIVIAIGSVIARKSRWMRPASGDKPEVNVHPEPDQTGAKKPVPEPPESIAASLLRSPLIRGLASPGVACPGYLPAETFADALISVLRKRRLDAPGGAGDGELLPGLIQSLGGESYAKELLGSLFVDVETIQEARERLIRWFNQSMESVSGTYRRHSQFCMHFWAALVVGILNVDAIALSQRLMADKALRAALVSRADQWGAEPRAGIAQPALPPKDLQWARTNIHQLRIPLGWDIFGEGKNPARELDLMEADVDSLPNPTSIWGWFLKVLGLLVSISAISQGAPFWFDLLNRMTNLRAANKPAAPKPSGST